MERIKGALFLDETQKGALRGGQQQGPFHQYPEPDLIMATALGTCLSTSLGTCLSTAVFGGGSSCDSDSSSTCDSDTSWTSD